ncbi:rhomboid family intramembrane serine protease [Salinarimonas chemoclinalis]|uniref:rhomboid family intramembrane serine protease n=1 Tax=Salinarimonas chemoclinalis TaxID=3241599 RepID=UPI0035581A9C
MQPDRFETTPPPAPPPEGPPRKPPREPAFNLPGVVVACIGLIVAIHAIVGLMGLEGRFGILVYFGFVPALWTTWLDADATSEIARRILEGDPIAMQRDMGFARIVMQEGSGGVWTALTYAFLHGSWMHVGLNAVWLAAFGTPIARRLGPERFLWLAALAAIAGALMHWATHAYDVTPMIGASAVVSGMMAASARFAFTPRGFGWLPPHLAPRLGLGEMLRNRTAMLFIGVWLAINLVFGVAAVPLGLADGGGIAWEAHVGGFLAGLLLFPWFDPSPRPPRDLA